MDTVRDWLSWVYEWATVLTGIVTGALAFVVPFIGDALNLVDMLVGVNLAPFGISAETAAAVTSVVALLKGLHAWHKSRGAPPAEPDYGAEM